MLKDINSYREVMEKCSHCAFCEAACPVFLADLLETHVARARMSVIKAALVDKTLPVSDRLHDIVNRCLVCSSCQTGCPAGVPVDEIVIAARHALYKGKRMGLPRRILLKQVMEKRGTSGIVRQAQAMAQKMGLAPGEIPQLAQTPFDTLYPPGYYAPEGQERARVAYFVGCATNAMYPDTGDAVMKVLQHNGIGVVLPEKIVCCGIPALTEGDLKTAEEMMKTNITALAGLEVTAIVTDCTSCGLTLTEKMIKVISPEDPVHEEASAISKIVRDVTEFLATMGLSQKPAQALEAYTYHVPCHGSRPDTVQDAPLKLLAAVPGSSYSEMAHPDQCCGAGGMFFADNKALSEKIRRDKLADIKGTGAPFVVTQCPSCRSYIDAGLDQGQKALHPMAALARAYGF